MDPVTEYAEWVDSLDQIATQLAHALKRDYALVRVDVWLEDPVLFRMEVQDPVGGKLFVRTITEDEVKANTTSLSKTRAYFKELRDWFNNKIEASRPIIHRRDAGDGWTEYNKPYTYRATFNTNAASYYRNGDTTYTISTA